MKFGLKVHHSDIAGMIDMGPEALEFALFPGDMDGSWIKDVAFAGPIILHMPEKFSDGSLVDPASPDGHIRSDSVAILKQTIDLAIALKAESVVLHPGGVRAKPEHVDPAPLLDSMRELKAYRPGAVMLLLENMPDIYWYNGVLHAACLFKHYDEITDVLETLDMGMCMDLCHAKLYCTATGEDFGAYIKALKPYIRHIHVSDARGSTQEGLQIGEGEIDFKGLLQILKGLDVVAVPEIIDGHKDGGAGYRIAVDRLKKIGFFDGVGQR